METKIVGPSNYQDLKAPRIGGYSTKIYARIALLIAIAAAPISCFYAALLKTSVDIPYWDDYQGVLEYLQKYAQLGTWFAKLRAVLLTQHNEYKTIFADAMIALQYEVSGHPSFVALMWIGNAFIFVELWLLWRSFLHQETDLPRRLLFFLPIVFMLFQLQYAETLNWASPGLQNIPVLVFALAAVQQLSRESRSGFLLAILFMVLCIASSGNGFGLMPVGALMLWQQRSLRRLGAWLMAGGLCAAGYFYRYNFHSSQQVSNGSVVDSAQYISPIFTLSFLGAAAGKVLPGRMYLSIVLGILLLGIFAWTVRRRYYQQNQPLFYYAFFIILTAVAVSGIRSKLGLACSVSMRYKIYSDLLLIFSYTALLELLTHSRSRQRLLFGSALAFSVLFCLVYDCVGFTFLKGRKADLVSGATLYEVSRHQLGPGRLHNSDDWPGVVEFNKGVRSIADTSESSGLYRFP